MEIHQLKTKVNALKSKLKAEKEPYLKEIKAKEQIAKREKELQKMQSELLEKQRVESLKIQHQKLQKTFKKNESILLNLRQELPSVIFEFCKSVLQTTDDPTSSVVKDLIDKAYQDYQQLLKVPSYNQFNKDIRDRNGKVLNAINQIESIVNETYGLKVHENMYFTSSYDKWDKLPTAIQDLVKQYKIDLINEFNEWNQ